VRSRSSSRSSSPAPGLVLASRSPQRRAILERLGVRFAVHPADVEELTDGPPEHVALENARRKVAAVRQARDEEAVLGVDTLVALDGRIYGKPSSQDAARETLLGLSGMTHQVVGGIALWREGELLTSVAVTDVTFRPLDPVLVAWYLATGEWRERAGGYAIQGRGAALVQAIHGDYENVVGLPVAALLDLCPTLILDSS
jgi:septum formation protein